MTDNKKQKEFDAVKYMRDQRSKLSEKLSNMTDVEIIEFFANLSKHRKIKPSA